MSMAHDLPGRSLNDIKLRLESGSWQTYNGVIEAQPWVPFSVPVSHREYRRVYMIRDRYIGQGSFGMVHGMVANVPWSSLPTDYKRTEGSLRYHLVAVKTGVNGRHHLREVVNAAAINELITAGVSPSFTRMLDCFCLNVLSHKTRLPPPTWRSYWSKFDGFAIKNGQAPNPEGVGNMKASSRYLRDGMSIGYTFYELATGPAFTGEKQPKLPKIRSDLTVEMYQMIQSLHAIHGARLVHCDIHPANYVFFSASDIRTDVSHITGDKHKQDVLKTMGEAGVNRPTLKHSAGSMLRFVIPATHIKDKTRRQRVPSPSINSVVTLSPDSPRVALVDYGAVNRCVVYGDMKTENAVRRFDIRLKDVPRYLVTDTPFHYGDMNGDTENEGWIPPSTLLTGPTTVATYRCTEQYNPRLENLNAVVHSTRSDVYSLCASVAQRIIGFDPFSCHIPVFRPPRNGEPSTTFCVPTKSDADGSRWVAHAPMPVKLRKLENDNGLVQERCNYLHAASAFYQMELDVMPVCKYITDYFGVNPKQVSSFLGRSDADKSVDEAFALEIAYNLLTRIVALGLPQRSAVAGTFFYHFINELYDHEDVDVHQHGWLQGMLTSVLVDKYYYNIKHARQFVKLLCDGLSWDPADRPSVRSLLMAPIFSELYEDRNLLRRSGHVPHHCWSADWPYHYATGQVTPKASPVEKRSTRRANPFLPFDTASYFMVGSDLGDVGLSQQQRYQQGAQYMHNLNVFISHHTNDPYLHLPNRCLPRLHSQISERLFKLNNKIGRLDTLTGESCVSQTHKRFYILLKGRINLLFRDVGNLAIAFKHMRKYHLSIPAWVQVRSSTKLLPTPGSSAASRVAKKRARSVTEVVSNSQRPLKRAKVDV